MVIITALSRNAPSCWSIRSFANRFPEKKQLQGLNFKFEPENEWSSDLDGGSEQIGPSSGASSCVCFLNPTSDMQPMSIFLIWLFSEFCWLGFFFPCERQTEISKSNARSEIQTPFILPVLRYQVYLKLPIWWHNKLYKDTHTKNKPLTVLRPHNTKASKQFLKKGKTKRCFELQWGAPFIHILHPLLPSQW